MTQQIVLVTGASSGIGRSIAALLAANGYRVFGTSRHPAQPTLDGFEMVALDVTSDESVAACVAEVIGRAGRIDALVNNAGVELLGALEEISIEEAKTLFETNFFGVMRMTNAVLPEMRQRRNGVIINIGSLAGTVSAPFHGIYSASKFALEGYTEALWFEVAPFGVRVALVEPGFFKSEINRNKALPARSLPDYAAERTTMIAAWDRSVEEAADPAPVAAKVLHIVQGRARGLRHRLGRYGLMSRFKLVSPERVLWVQVRRQFGLKP